MQQNQEKFQAAGATLVAISSDALDATGNFLKSLDPAERITFPLLSDVDHKVIRAYGVYDEDHEIALPALFLIDPIEGRIHWKYIGESITDRPEEEIILEQLQQLK